MEYPDFFARFYDLMYREIKSSEDCTFYLEEIRKAKGPILEIGVGTGRLFTRALAERFDMYGIDISPSMTHVLKKKISADQYFRISNQNVMDFHFEKKFDLILAPFRVFSHLLSVKDQLTALNNIYTHLKDGGTFIFDLFVPDPLLLANGLKKKMDYEGEYEPGKKIRRIVSTHSDIVNQITNVIWEIAWEEAKGWQKKVWEMPFRFYFAHEVEHLVARTSFSIRNKFGDFKRNALGPLSREMIFVCCRE